MTPDQGENPERSRRPVADQAKAARYSLSERELDVLYLMQEGLHDQEIAYRLGVSRDAVSERVGIIIEKMGARSRTDDAALFFVLRMSIAHFLLRSLTQQVTRSFHSVASAQRLRFRVALLAQLLDSGHEAMPQATGGWLPDPGAAPRNASAARRSGRSARASVHHRASDWPCRRNCACDGIFVPVSSVLRTDANPACWTGYES